MIHNNIIALRFLLLNILKGNVGISKIQHDTQESNKINVILLLYLYLHFRVPGLMRRIIWIGTVSVTEEDLFLFIVTETKSLK